MNWLGKLVQKQVNKKDLVLDLGCGTMAAILDTCPAYPKTRLKCRFILGLDVYTPYLEEIKNKSGLAVMRWNLSTELPFPDHSFDIVLLLDILEHLELQDAYRLLDEAERCARKKIIVYTPSEFVNNLENTKEIFPFAGLGANPAQEHLSFISPEYLAERGYELSHPEPSRNTYGVKCL